MHPDPALTPVIYVPVAPVGIVAVTAVGVAHVLLFRSTGLKGAEWLESAVAGVRSTLGLN